MAADIKYIGKTDVGLQRANNEDAYCVRHIWSDDYVLAVVIDGVGGYEGGEVAAAIAETSIVSYLERYPNGDRLDLLKHAVIFANNAIVEGRAGNENLSMMSCVLTAILVDVVDRQFHMVHVGDTRLYQYCQDTLLKLSHDHSLVGYREEEGFLTEEEAMRHPQRNIINRDVGSAYHEINDRHFLESATYPLLPESILLLCSDGLSDMLKSAEIKSILSEKGTLEEKSDALIARANFYGGKDNVTVVLVAFGEQSVDNGYSKEEEQVCRLVARHAQKGCKYKSLSLVWRALVGK